MSPQERQIVAEIIRLVRQVVEDDQASRRGRAGAAFSIRETT